MAAHLIYQRLIEEGLAIVKAVSDHYDGVCRSPWNQIEWGNHYTRAMASYSVLLALSVFRYLAVEKTATFHPESPQKIFSLSSPPVRRGGSTARSSKGIVVSKTGMSSR